MATPELLHYRPWTGTFRGPGATVWPIARTAVGQMFHRGLFWVLYALSLVFFLFFLFGRYLFAFLETLPAPTDTEAALNLPALGRWLRNLVDLDGTGKTYRAFISLQ